MTYPTWLIENWNYDRTLGGKQFRCDQLTRPWRAGHPYLPAQWFRSWESAIWYVRQQIRLERIRLERVRLEHGL